MFFKKIYDLYWFKFSKIRSYIVEILWFDIKRNTNTDARFDYKEDVGWSKQSKFGNRGTASWTKSIKISLRELKSYIREDYCNYQFIDLGCGRGKPCIVYCEMQKKNKFKSLYTPLGIDYSFNSLKIAEKNRVNLEFEASVCGGIPIIRSLKEGLIANKINKVFGIFP